MDNYRNVASDRDFLLNTETAKELYHGYAETQPVFDYHNHLSARDIAEHRRFSDLTELWLETDHYKWRAMRACGVEERYITGDADPYARFMMWAETMPRLIGSPLYHWTHLELDRYFGIDEALDAGSADRIWHKTQEMLREDGFDAVSLLEKMNVKVLCTTDDPIDDLRWHKQIRKDDTIPFKVLPSFRPDRYLAGDREAEEKLCRRYKTGDLKTALTRALDFFCENGALVSDHGFSVFRYGTDERLTDLMDFLGKAYSDREIVMQLHLGALRNASPRLMKSIGPDAGGDSIGRTTDPYALAAYFGRLEERGELPESIIYNLNPADNGVLSTLAVDFAPRVRYGAAWWMSDHMRGITAQLDELMETGALASTIGMLTDSRSFTSFVRHEYYRRILCRRLGELVESGLYPGDIKTIGAIVSDICYNNADRLFKE
mgnify:CR=1 FL=1